MNQQYVRPYTVGNRCKDSMTTVWDQIDDTGICLLAPESTWRCTVRRSPAPHEKDIDHIYENHIYSHMDNSTSVSDDTNHVQLYKHQCCTTNPETRRMEFPMFLTMIWQVKNLISQPRKSKKINLAIDLLSLGRYAPGPQVLTYRPPFFRGVRIWSPFRVPGPERRVRRCRCFGVGRL